VGVRRGRRGGLGGLELIEEALGGEMWAVVLVGTFATIALSWLMPSRSKRLHLLLEGLLGVFLGLSLFVILAFDRPLFGQVSVEPRAYELVRDRTIATDPP